ncbi:MAG: PDZ domain-containing protein [Micromonosporaceae bacterium]|nr:PDZ domain-containing protein [Micromonosporaceae bacterium]
MAYVGMAVFALGILISVSLHEAGHLGTAKLFGMKASRFFVGFGPTLWSFRRGETEYGLKGIPLGGFVKIVGMTPQDDDTTPADQHRAMWRFPVWKRTVVMVAGSATHFVLGFVVLWGVFAFAPLNDFERLDASLPAVSGVSECVAVEFEVDPETGAPRQCVPGQDPDSAAVQAGLQPGDVITAINDQPVTGWQDLTERIQAAGDQTVTLTIERDGQARTAEVKVPRVEQVREDIDPGTTPSEVTDADLEQVGVLGIFPEVPRTRHGPVAGVGLAADQTGFIFQGTFEALGRLPERVPQLWEAVFGGHRDPETPMSVVGASRLGGELWERGELPTFLVLLAALNFFVGVFNLLPLLPLDGGHIAIAWFEKARSWLYARLGRPDPGRVDYYKMMPVTYVVILVMAGFFLLTIAADIVNPIRLPF